MSHVRPLTCAIIQNLDTHEVQFFGILMTRLNTYMDYVTRQPPMHHPLETRYDEVVDKQQPNYQGSKFQPLVGGVLKFKMNFTRFSIKLTQLHYTKNNSELLWINIIVNNFIKIKHVYNQDMIYIQLVVARFNLWSLKRDSIFLPSNYQFTLW